MPAGFDDCVHGMSDREGVRPVMVRHLSVVLPYCQRKTEQVIKVKPAEEKILVSSWKLLFPEIFVRIRQEFFIYWITFHFQEFRVWRSKRKLKWGRNVMQFTKKSQRTIFQI